MLVTKKAHVKIDASLLSNQGAASSSSAGSGTAGAAPTPVPPSAAVTATTPSSVGSKRKYHLHGADLLFARLRDSNFAVIGPNLSKEILRLDSEYKVFISTS